MKDIAIRILASVVVILVIALLIHLFASFSYLDWNWLALTTIKERVAILFLSVPVAMIFIILIFIW